MLHGTARRALASTTAESAAPEPHAGYSSRAAVARKKATPARKRFA
jgi:hypothetical protein